MVKSLDVFSWLEHVKTIIFHGEIAMDLEISGLDQGCEQLLRGLAIRISLAAGHPTSGARGTLSHPETRMVKNVSVSLILFPP